MFKISTLTKLTFIIACASFTSLSALELNITTPTGEIISLDVQPEETMEQVVASIENYLEEKELTLQQCTFDLYAGQRAAEKNPKKVVRDYDYNRAVSSSEISDIRFIVLTLSNTPLLKLKKYKKDIESAGDRINNVHPLNFWRVIFTDKEMIAAMHNIKGRDRIWKSFVNGSTDGFDDAVALNLMHTSYIEDFASRVGIDVNIILNTLKHHEWTNFIKLLLIHVPRDGNPDRYNM